MFDFIKLQFEMKVITEQDVRNFNPKWLTAAEVEKIIGTQPIK